MCRAALLIILLARSVKCATVPHRAAKNWHHQLTSELLIHDVNSSQLALVHFANLDVVELREALLDARRDTVTHLTSYSCSAMRYCVAPRIQ